MDTVKEINKDLVFEFMKKHRHTICFEEIRFSARLLSNWMGITVYKARKFLKQLSEEGKITYGCYIHCDYDEYGRVEYMSPPICGYVIND